MPRGISESPKLKKNYFITANSDIFIANLIFNVLDQRIETFIFTLFEFTAQKNLF